MGVVGFNFTRIDVERKDIAKGNVNIRNNISIKNIDKTDIGLGGEKQNVLRVSFEFTSTYDPQIGNILLAGTLLYLEEQKRSKEILDTWKKEKRVNKEIMTPILNTVLAKCNVQALILSQEVNLPAPMPLPKVQINDKDESNYIG